MKFKDAKEEQDYHKNNYRSDGVYKRRYTAESRQYYLGKFVYNNVPNNSIVLDVGCNGGTIGLLLKNKGCYIKGIDVVEELVELACSRGIFAKVGTAEKLNYEDESFDVVTCIEVLEHLYDPEVAMNEAFRVLKKGGIYLSSFPNEETLGDYHQKIYTLDDIRALFKKKFKKITLMGIAENKVGGKEAKWYGVMAVKGE